MKEVSSGRDLEESSTYTTWKGAAKGAQKDT
jgi:hypothetical protein